MPYQLTFCSYKKTSKIEKLIGYIFFYASTFMRCISGKYQLIYVHYASFSSLPVLLDWI